MFKLHLISELKEALVSLADIKPGILKPEAPTQPLSPPQHRMVIYDKKCVGCGACATVCPADAISLLENRKHRVITIKIAQCIYCGMCADTCPEQALSLLAGDELSSSTKENLLHELKIKLKRCEQCRTIMGPEKSIIKTVKNIFSPRGLTSRDLEWINLCPSCRRKFHSSHIIKQHIR
jgi:formate hydrogenlyase subunit 6/NADH:ubiquinone oxidoreductase subunit I